MWKYRVSAEQTVEKVAQGFMRNRAAGRGTQSVLQFLTQHLGRACLITKWAGRHISRRFQRPNKSYMGTPSLAVPPHTYPSIPCRIQPCQWLTRNEAHKVVLIMSVYSVGLPSILFLQCGQLLFWSQLHSQLSAEFYWEALLQLCPKVARFSSAPSPCFGFTPLDYTTGWPSSDFWSYLGPNTLEATVKTACLV